MKTVEILALLVWSVPLVVLVLGGIGAGANRSEETDESQTAEND